MRYSITSQALCGAITVSALAVPNSQVQKRVQHVDISSFKNFPTVDPQVFADKANDSIKEFFSKGMFNDGPMDEFGKWLDRPMAMLESVDDRLELHFDNLEHFLEKGQASSAKEKLNVKKGFEEFETEVKKDIKSFRHGSSNRAKYSLYSWGDLFGFPSQETDQPTEESSGGKEDTTGDNTGDNAGDNTEGDAAQATATETPTAASPPETTTFGQSTTAVAQPTTSASGSKEDPGNYASAEGSKKSSDGGDDAAAAAGTCNPSNPNVRIEWDSYSSADRTAFVKAIECLKKNPSAGSQYTGAQNRYEDLVSVHRDMTNNIHQTAAFLVWHRYFVWVFEQLLRDECGFDRAMPWWDETKHAGAFAQSDVFTDAWFGHLPAKTSDGQGTCIESGEFSGDILHVGPGTGNTDHCLSRAVDESQTAQCNQDFTNNCLSMGSYDDFRDCFELGPHGYGHNGIGAVMAEVSASVGDPIFFMHHLFVDHVFRIWQNANPSRRTTINGCADKANPCTPITLDTKLSSSGLRPDITVGEALNTLGGTFCYRYNY
ncbi:hypothetical protein F5Y03DRAFT_14985 [Xylaria venustula]|nr:hypothetical protein F5Y03DRAFT_14985 [Xylaria venustula]